MMKIIHASIISEFIAEFDASEDKPGKKMAVFNRCRTKNPYLFLLQTFRKWDTQRIFIAVCPTAILYC